VLEQLTSNGGALLHAAREQGALLKEGLESLHREYPQIISAVRGRGLMLGLELGVDRGYLPAACSGYAEQELLASAVSAYLLNREKIRVAPTLNGGSVIRIERRLRLPLRSAAVSWWALPICWPC